MIKALNKNIMHKIHKIAKIKELNAISTCGRILTRYPINPNNVFIISTSKGFLLSKHHSSYKTKGKVCLKFK